MNDHERIAKEYFDAFHAGRIDEVFGYFADDGVVKYGAEPEKPARVFFPEAKEMIAQIKFETHGVYSSSETNNVIIHFSFTMPSEDGGAKTIEAIDIIEFDRDRKITRVKVIASG